MLIIRRTHASASTTIDAVSGSACISLPWTIAPTCISSDLVQHIALDPRLGLQFQVVVGGDRAVHRAVDDHVRDADFAFDSRCSLITSVPGLIVDGRHLAVDRAIDAQAAGEQNVAVDRGAGADQAVQPLLRRRGFLRSNMGLSYERFKLRVAFGRRSVRFRCTLACSVRQLAARRDADRPFNCADNT